METDVSLTPLPALESLLPPTGLACPVSMGEFLLCHIVSCFVVFGCCLLRTATF